MEHHGKSQIHISCRKESCACTPLQVWREVWRADLPLMVVLGIITFMVACFRMGSQRIGTIVLFAFIALVIMFTWYLATRSSRQPSDRQATSPHQRNELGWTPLMDACMTGDLEGAQAQLESGASIDARDTLGFTPLHQACRLCNFEVAEFLIAQGSPVDVIDTIGWTPLHIAAGMGALPIVELLLENGADPDRMTYDNITPVEAAEQMGYTETADLIRRYSRDSGAPGEDF